MKVAVCSDLHLEFGGIELENPGDVEVLILSGDICVASDFREPDKYGIMSTEKTDRVWNFFRTCSENFPHVVYVVGNHEHYHGDFKNTIDILRLRLAAYENVHILDKEVFRHTSMVNQHDYLFVGGTLWTDMNKEDPLTLHSMSSMMNDFRCVNNSNREVNFKTYEPVSKEVGMTDEEYLAQPHEKRFKTVFKTRTARFSPEDAVEDHKKMLDYIKFVVSEAKPWEAVIVCGHHAPSKQSTHPRYKDETVMNGGYSSDLSEYILDHPQIKLWTHGHTHEEFDYMIGETRIVCNPRGYIGYEARAEEFKLKVVEV